MSTSKSLLTALFLLSTLFAPINAQDEPHTYWEFNPNPEEFHLSEPYPNPFNPAVNINFIQQKTSVVNIGVFDVKGRELTILFDGLMLRGKSGFTWNAAIYPTGIYFIKARSGNQVQVKKIQLLK